MRDSDPIQVALEHATGSLAEAAISLTLAMLVAGRSPLAHGLCVLADGAEAELAAVAAIACRRRGGARGWGEC
jgi:hypothetical protein